MVDIKEQTDCLASMSEIASCSYEARKHGIKNGMFLGQAVKQCPGLKTLPYDFEVCSLIVFLINFTKSGHLPTLKQREGFLIK